MTFKQTDFHFRQFSQRMEDAFLGDKTRGWNSWETSVINMEINNINLGVING